MWKSGKSLAAARHFSPHPIVDNFAVFHRPFLGRKRDKVIHREVFHFPQGLWNFSG